MRLLIASLLLVAAAVGQCPSGIPFNLAVVPQWTQVLNQFYNNNAEPHSWTVNLCTMVNPPSGSCASNGPGYASESGATTGGCETTWNSLISSQWDSTSGTGTIVYGQTAASNHPGWTATVQLTCDAGGNNALTPTMNQINVAGANVDSLNFAFTFKTAAVCPSGPNPTPVPATPAPPTPASLAYVTYYNCTDRAFCASGCQYGTIPGGSCQPNGNGKTQIFDCRPELHVCGDLTYFSDADCENLLETNGFVCDDHTPCTTKPGSLTGRCRSAAGAESLELLQCASENCTECTSVNSIPIGVCLPLSQSWRAVLSLAGKQLPSLIEGVGASGSFMYTGSALCNAVRVVQFNASPVCAGPSSTQYVPQSSCIMGQKVTCTWT